MLSITNQTYSTLYYTINQTIFKYEAELWKLIDFTEELRAKLKFSGNQNRAIGTVNGNESTYPIDEIDPMNGHVYADIQIKQEQEYEDISLDFGTITELTNKQTSSKQRPNACGQCKKRFKFNSSLQLYIHTNGAQ